MADDTNGGTQSNGFSRPSAAGRIMPRSPRAAIQPESVPLPPSRSRSARNRWVVFGHAVISCLFLASIAIGAGAYFGKREFNAPGPLTEERTVVIPPKSGLSDVATALNEQGVIDSPLLFSTIVRILKKNEDLKAGEYDFKPGVSMREVTDLLVEGKSILHKITVPEGRTTQEIVDLVNGADFLTGTITGTPREGSMLPETYNFNRGTSRQDAIDRMQAAEKHALDDVWKARSPDLPLKSPAELVTLASIVEKETGKADERPRVAAVFVNRLKKNMRLQSDPTVIYGIAGGAGRLDRPLLKGDLDKPTPYNTYQISGLPPGPIANPGRAALEAAANPSQTNELYFVADGTGGHVFAETLDQHNKNVAHWRQLQQQGTGGTNPLPANPTPANPVPANSPTPANPISTQPADAVPATGASQPAADQPATAPADGGTPPATPGTNANGTNNFADPVANTKLDPLLNKTFDLNSPQTVPDVSNVGVPDATGASANPDGSQPAAGATPAKPAKKRPPKKKPRPKPAADPDADPALSNPN